MLNIKNKSFYLKGMCNDSGGGELVFICKIKKNYIYVNIIGKIFFCAMLNNDDN